MEYIETKQLLIKNKNPKEWFGFDYTLNLYKGCSHGCIYCDSRSQCYRIDNFDVVRAKKDAIAILNKELRNKKKKGIIGMGSMSDPYNPSETDEKLTQETLKLLNYYGFGVGVHTKSDLVLRDIELLKNINTHNQTVVNITITTSSDEISKKIEPNVCPSSRRFEVVKKLKEAGLICGITMTPVLPYITDDKEDLKLFIQKAVESKADYILTYMTVTLRENQRDYYYEKLDEYFPGLSFTYKRIYNNRYSCETLKWKENYEYLKKECEKHHILYEMDDIVALIESNKKEVEQLSLF